MDQQTIRPRNDIPVEFTWDTASIYPTPADWEVAVDSLLADIAHMERFRDRLAEGGPALLLECLTYKEDMTNRAQRIGMYAYLDYSVDTTNQDALARLGRARSAQSALWAALAFVEPEVVNLGFDLLSRWTEEDPRFAIYRHFFDNLERSAAHLRSSEIEELLGMLADPFDTASATHNILTNAELVFQPAVGSDPERRVELAQGTVSALVTDPDRNVRRTAWENYADAHLAFKNTMANCLAAGVKQQVFLSRARRYGSALEAALNDYNVPTTVFHNLIATFRKHLPTWHRYWRLRKRALGLDALREYDVKAPLTSAKPYVSYNQAVEWICAGMAPLGDEYVGLVRRGCTSDRWVDIYPNRGKAAGAYSYGTPGTHPFIFMSYNDDLFSLSTLAHELGHSLHSWYTWRTQPLVYERYSLFAAEVASNFNQVLVRDYLFRTQTDRDFQISVIEEAMANFHRYFFIMPTLARFELELHTRAEQGKPLTADGMNSLMADLFAEGYGDEVEMDRARTGSTWAQFSTHLYSNFYVYQYATGISGAHALGQKVLAGEPGAVERYLEFLSAGSSLYPLDALKRAGADLATPEPVEATFAVLERYVARLEELIG
jgi:oligoendopeptidase F